MDDVWYRAALILGALLVAGAVIYVQRRRSKRPFRDVATGDLDPGVYLFSSNTCSTCEKARRTLDDRVGVGQYNEVVWEEDGDRFRNLGVDAVPSVLVVGGGGRGRLYVGDVEPALASVDP